MIEGKRVIWGSENMFFIVFGNCYMYNLTLRSRISIDFFQTFLLESHMLFNPTFFIDSKNVPSVCASVPLREQCKWLHKFSLGEQIGHSTALMLVHFSDALLLFTVESLSRKKKSDKASSAISCWLFFHVNQLSDKDQPMFLSVVWRVLLFFSFFVLLGGNWGLLEMCTGGKKAKLQQFFKKNQF